MDGLPVTLIVKAPNQQIEDQTIKCELTWTIQQLKGHLSEVYPLKPKTGDQKLIYSGQLLTDSVVLKDVLRRYEGQDIHTLHLVCAMPQMSYKPNKPSPPANMSQASPSQSGNSTSAASSPQTAEPNITNVNNRERRMSGEIPSGVRRRGAGNNTPPYQNDENYWRQENERNEPRLYFPQDMQFVQRVQADNGEGRNVWRNTRYQAGPYINNGAVNNFAQVPIMNDPIAFAAAQMAWVQHIQAQYMQFYTQAMQTATSMNASLDNVQPQQQIPNQEPQADDAPAAAEEPPHREIRPANQLFHELDWDWLDWFYMASRICVMFAIIYFYSSPLRFIIVLLTAFLIYLYQIRYFQALVQNNNAENANNNNAVPANNNNGEQPPNEANVEENPDVVAAENPPNTNNQANEIIQENHQPSYLAITWTVITSFLTSLLPDAPNAI